MIRAMSEWAVSVIVAAFLCALAEALLPEKEAGVSRGVKFLSAMIMSVVVLMPVLNAVKSLNGFAYKSPGIPSVYKTGENVDAETIAQKADEASYEIIRSVSESRISEELTSAVSDKFTRDDFHIVTKITVSGETDIAGVESVTVFYSEPDFPSEPVCDYIEEEFGITAYAVTNNGDD